MSHNDQNPHIHTIFKIFNICVLYTAHIYTTIHGFIQLCTLINNTTWTH